MSYSEILDEAAPYNEWSSHSLMVDLFPTIDSSSPVKVLDIASLIAEDHSGVSSRHDHKLMIVITSIILIIIIIVFYITRDLIVSRVGAC